MHAKCFYTKILFILIITLNSCKKDSFISVDKLDRALALADYNNLYLASATPDANWTGNSLNCNPGTNSADVQAKVLMRINYFRKLAGLSHNITFDPVKDAKCLEAALMMTANGTLNHYPPDTWKCYSADGKQAAGSSNLYLGRINSAAISGYIDDPGTSNVDCGHRRWILYSKASIMGHGATSNADALWVTSGSVTPKVMPEYIPWPPEGFVPAPLVYSKWSLGIPGGDFSNATVEMIGPEGVISAISILSSTKTSYGDNTIVWQPNGINTTSDTDISYKVAVKNIIVSGVSKNYEYTVVIFNPDVE